MSALVVDEREALVRRRRQRLQRRVDALLRQPETQLGNQNGEPGNIGKCQSKRMSIRIAVKKERETESEWPNKVKPS